jgi:hypothetical protein
MRTPQYILFHLCGVIIQDLDELIFSDQDLYRKVRKNQDLSDSIDVAIRQMQTGLIDFNRFTTSLSQITGLPVNASDLQNQIMDRARLNQPVFDLIHEIEPEVQNWLAFDLPDLFLESFELRAQLSEVFPVDKIVFTADLGLENLVPDLYYKFQGILGCPLDAIMVVDSDRARAVEAVRQRISSSIYEYPQLFKRELILRKLIEMEGDEIHPDRSARIS